MIFPWKTWRLSSQSSLKPLKNGLATVAQVRSDVDEKDPVLMSKRFREKFLGWISNGNQGPGDYGW